MPSLSIPPAMDGHSFSNSVGPQLDARGFVLATPMSHVFANNHWSFPNQPFGLPCPAQSENQQSCFNGVSDMHTDLLPQDLSNFDFSGLDLPQDLSCLDDQLIFSPQNDSLSEYASTNFLNADMAPTVPTIWDIKTPAPVQESSNRFQGLNSLDDISAIINTPPIGGYQRPQTQPEEEEEVDVEEAEELGHVDTYADYKPSKSKIGISHPDRVVETNTLSSVPPPDITYTLSIPEDTIKDGLLSALQLEAITYACQQHEVILQNSQRAGFLIGDGAGVGKGRTVAGIILENNLKGRKKALWFSVSNDLKYDAERDLQDIGAVSIRVHALNKIKYGDTATSEGVLFVTYSALIGESQAGGQHRTRLKQILDWCEPEFDGVIIFDECHKAKNATSTKMGKAVLDLQNKLPLARVVYASATGASEPKNMIYMSRLGIWGEGTPFRTFDDFLHTIEKRGVGAMEIVAMDMKVSGMYIARQLSFSGVSFRIEEISLDNDFKLVYNKAAKLWAEALRVFMQAADELCMSSRKSLWGQFWSSHQRFFKYLCIAAKVRCLVELAKKELEAGKCVVIGLQSTGEARTREVLDENDGHLDRFVSAAEGVFQSLVFKHFPSEKQMREKGAGNKRKRKPRARQSKQPRQGTDIAVINISDDSSTESDVMDSDSNSSPDSIQDNNDDVIFVDQTSYQKARLEDMKQGLLNKIAELGKELPLNTLDELIDKFGGPEKVSEMTGRKGRVVRRPDGSVHYESRAEQGHTIDQINIKEKDRFMNGEKLVAIISEAASSGISLQADRRVKNQCRRVHMTLELPWSADRAIQQFGRTHRSNQVNAPEYIFLISELAGERRFASIVAKRLESLGALTHGDRRATESRDLSKYNFENKYGTKALDKITKTILGQTESKVPPPKDYPGGEAMFFRDMKYGMMDVGMLCSQSRLGINIEKDCNITKFLNRILGLEVHKQNSLFQYFTDNFDYLIEMDKKVGNYDLGILDLAPGNDQIYEETQEKFLTAGNPQDGQVVLYKISVDRGMPWSEALEKFETLTKPDEGFYMSYRLRSNHPCVLLAVQGKERNMILYKPNIGKQLQPESIDKLQQKYRKVTPADVQDSWENQFNFSLRKCSHANQYGRCKRIDDGQECTMGTRLRQYHMLCGALLRVWKRVSDIVADITSSSILQIVRLKTKDSNKQVGIKIPETCITKVRQELLRMDSEVKQRRREKEQKALEQQALEQQALEQRQAEEHQRLMAQQQHQELFSNLFNQSLAATSLTTPYISFPSFPSVPNPLEEILDLTIRNSSPSSSQAALDVDNFSRPTEPLVDNFNFEEFIQEQPRQESQPVEGSTSVQHNDLLDILLPFNSFITTTPTQTVPASPSSDASSSVPMVVSSSFSSSLSHFTPSITPSSSSSLLSQVSLPPTDQQMLSLPNGHSRSEANINAREVLNSMLRGGPEVRQSVIQYQQPE